MQKTIPKCKSHIDEPITNYCMQIGCYTELCAACICQHAEAHNRGNTKPKFQLMKQTFSNACDIMSKIQQQINDERNRVSAIIEKANIRQLQAFGILKQARQQTILTVNRTFDELENNYQEHLEHEKFKTGLLNQTRLNQLYSELNKHNLELYNTYKDLTTTNNTRLIRTIHNELIPTTISYIENTAKQLSSNENFQPGLLYRPAYLQQVVAGIKKLISTTVSYTLPQKTSANQFLRTRSISKTRQSLINLKASNLNLGRQSSVQRSASFLKNGLGSPRNMVMTSKQNYFPVRDEHSKGFGQTYF